MAVKINGATVECTGYEFALMDYGEIIDKGTLEDLRERKERLHLSGKLVFSATYRTEWTPVKDDQTIAS